MDRFKLDHQGKIDSELLIQYLQSATPEEIDELANSYQYGNEPAWHRFAKGAYNHPITWWMGLFQIQMQMGLWGYQRKSEAQTRANYFAQITSMIWNNGETNTFNRVFMYNLKHRKADVLGRLAGGKFTSYASKGGRLGMKNMSERVSTTVNLSNFVLASYGAAIKSIGSGYRSAENIFNHC